MFVLGSCPAFPAVFFVEQVGVFLPFEGGLIAAILLQTVEILEEQQPGGLLGVVELGGAAGFFAEHVVDIFEGLFEHGGPV